MNNIRKYFFFLILILVGNISVSFAQSEWEVIGNVKFRACQKLPDDRVCIVTSAGYILWSNNDGLSWTPQTINSAIALNGIAFSTPSTGLITTDSNIIYRTTNGGHSWSPIVLPIIGHLNGIASLAKDSFMVCGENGLCLLSADAGLTWNPRGPQITAALKKCIFLNSTEVYITADSGMLFHSRDAGLSWKKISTPFSSPIFSFDRSSLGKIIIGTDSALVAASNDGGLTWTRRKLTPSISSEISLIKFLNKDTIVAFQNNYYRFISTNGGESWDSIYINTTFENTIIRFVTYNDSWVNSLGQLLAIGDESTIYRVSTDGFTGKIISHYGVISGRNPYFEFSPGSDSYIHGISNTLNNAFVVSKDKGYTWITHQEPTFSTGSYIGLHFTNDSTGVIFTGQGQSKYFDAPQTTTNNGKSWTGLPISQLPHKAWQLFKHGFDGKLFIFSDSVIYVSSDQGYNWSSYANYAVPSDSGMPSNISRMMDASFFGSNEIRLLVKFLGAGSIQYYYASSTDGGKTWTGMPLNSQGNLLYSMAFVNSLNGFIVGGNGFVLHSTDAGVSWNSTMIGNSALRCVSFNNNGRVGIVSGDSSMIYMTSDSGITWSGGRIIGAAIPENSRFYKAVFLNDTTLFVQSNDVVIRKNIQKDTQSTIVEGNLKNSSQYLFIATYPNPATSTIAHCRLFGLYAIDKLSIHVKLVDILGRNIKDLTDQALQVSNNSTPILDIDISDLPTSTYFVSFTSSGGSFIAPLLVLH